jgi:hypothetical protein
MRPQAGSASPAAFVPRERDLDFVFACLARSESCSIVGLSNMGKSSLLRTLAALDARTVAARLARANRRQPLFVYVDCNLMLELTGQGFYEVILRALIEALEGTRQLQSVLPAVQACYDRLVEAQGAFQVSLNFNEAIAAALEQLDRMLVLLLDEFDEAFAALDGRVFLNLRALDDKYGDRIAYITATVQPLSAGRADADANVDEFCELFAQRAYHLGLLGPDDARALVTLLAARKGVALAGDEVEFVLAQAGGHPGLISATVQALIRAGPGVAPDHRDGLFGLVASALDDDENVRRELSKLWQQLGPEEQEGAIRFVTGGVEAAGPAAVARLAALGILGDGDEPRFPGRLLSEYVRRQRRIRQDVPPGVWIDVEAGDVWVDGAPAPALTDLEYRLLLLLYGRLEKICDKYQIVEAVWGQDYIDEVDDARIEKLISRVRGKIEQDPANPRYLLTVRGRGYRLVRG